MAKTLVAKNIAGINNVVFSIGSVGKITAISVGCEVNFGEMGLSQTVDIWADLTVAQKIVAQNFYARLKAIVEETLIASK